MSCIDNLDILSTLSGEDYAFIISCGSHKISTISTLRSAVGGAKDGFANLAALLAVAPDKAGQLGVTAEGYYNISIGTNVGDWRTTFLDDGTYIRPMKGLYMNYGGITTTAGAINAAGGGTEHWLYNNGLDNVLNIQNTSAIAHSVICFLGNTADKRWGAFGIGGPSVSSEYADTFFLGLSPLASTPAGNPVDFTISQESSDSGGYLNHRRMRIFGGDKSITFYDYTAASVVGNIALKIASDGKVSIGTGTASVSAKLTVAGELHSNGSAAAVRSYAQNLDGTYIQMHCPSNGTIQLISSPNGSAASYSATTNEWTNYATVFSGFLGLPSYTVVQAGSLTPTAGRMIYISNEAGGAVPAFGDGSSWRRVTDRNVIS